MSYKYVVQRSARAGDILLLTLAPKQPNNRLSFEPGQYATIGFMRGGRPTPMRCFSIVSTPKGGLLQFAMRIRGDFTQTAAELAIGETVRVQGPFGNFTIDSTYDERIVMLAGGIGITPIMSMLRDVTERQLALPIMLVFANRSATSIPFYEELRSLQQRNPYLRVQFFCSDITASPDRNFIPGNITSEYIEQLTSGTYAGSTYFICGPGGFTQSIERSLLERGVHESRILHESFAQTSKQTFDSRFGIRTITYGMAAASMALMFGFIMILDLSRTVPRLASAESKPTITQQPAQSSSTSSGNATSPAATSTPSPTTPTPSISSNNSSNAPNNSSDQQTSTYQPPVSSVS